MKFLTILLLIAINAYATSHRPQDFLNSIQGTQNEGEQIVEHFCATCHAEKPLINLGAPKINNKIDWKIRLRQGFKQLFHNTSQGKNLMPARGGCFECSDEQLRLAIEALLPKERV